MHRRHQHTNIPTEIIRTIVSIAETGSFSKTGEKLKLGQPAISAQVKRLQLLIGGPVFEKAPGVWCRQHAAARCSRMRAS
jgi:DNA-binding transcriptional LysR family regulator